MNEEIYQSPSASSKHTTSLLSAVNKKNYFYFSVSGQMALFLLCVFYIFIISFKCLKPSREQMFFMFFIHDEMVSI